MASQLGCSSNHRTCSSTTYLAAGSKPWQHTTPPSTHHHDQQQQQQQQPHQVRSGSSRGTDGQGASPPPVAAAGGAKGSGSGVDVAAVAAWLRGCSSVALSYSPPGRTRSGQPAFTATVEMLQGHTFLVSFFQHVAAVRQVFNPLEKDDVIGITNYLDIGLQLAVPLVEGAGGQGAAAGGSWQVNKNLLLKGKLGTDSVALLAAAKTWFNPSLAGALAAEYSFKTGSTRWGLTLQIENFGALRYERSREALVHGRVLTQRHEATPAEEAMAEGERPLVHRDAADDVFNVPEPASVNYM